MPAAERGVDAGVAQHAGDVGAVVRAAEQQPLASLYQPVVALQNDAPAGAVHLVDALQIEDDVRGVAGAQAFKARGQGFRGAKKQRPFEFHHGDALAEGGQCGHLFRLAHLARMHGVGGELAANY